MTPSQRPQQSIVVTGASTGIGRAAVVGLLDAGFRVFAGVRNDRDAVELRSQVPTTAASRLETLTLDVTRPEQIAAAVARVGAATGEHGLWGLFNNAGISVQGPLEYLPLADLRRQLEVNVVGQVAVTQAFIPLLRKARGRILTTGSISGFFTAPALAPYSMSKYAMEAFSDALRRELRPWGIEVSLLQPGPIATEIWRKGLSESAATVSNAAPDLLANYGGLMESLRRVGEDAARGAAPVSVVTRDVLHAFTAARPKTRYMMGTGVRARKFLSRLPDRWLDAVLARALHWG